MDHLLSDLLTGLLGGFDLAHAGRGLGLDLGQLGHFLGVQDVTPLPATPVEGGGALPALPGVGTGVEGAVPNQLELWHLFLAADIVVKAVMMMLVAASVWCWAIIFEKWVRLRRLRRRAAAFEDTFWSGNSLEELYDRIGDDPRDPMAAVFVAGMKEWRHANQRGLVSTGTMRAGLHQRIERVMGVAQTRELGRVEGVDWQQAKCCTGEGVLPDSTRAARARAGPAPPVGDPAAGRGGPPRGHQAPPHRAREDGARGAVARPRHLR